MGKSRLGHKTWFDNQGEAVRWDQGTGTRHLTVEAGMVCNLWRGEWAESFFDLLLTRRDKNNKGDVWHYSPSDEEQQNFLWMYTLTSDSITVKRIWFSSRKSSASRNFCSILKLAVTTSDRAMTLHGRESPIVIAWRNETAEPTTLFSLLSTSALTRR